MVSRLNFFPTMLLLTTNLFIFFLPVIKIKWKKSMTRILYYLYRNHCQQYPFLKRFFSGGSFFIQFVLLQFKEMQINSATNLPTHGKL